MHSSNKIRESRYTNKTTIMNQIDKDFVYNRFPKTDHDIELFETYRKDYLSGIVSCANQHSISEIQRYFPVYEGTEGAEFQKNIVPLQPQLGNSQKRFTKSCSKCLIVQLCMLNSHGFM